MTAGESGDPPAFFQLFADEYARKILLAADEEPRTAKSLSRICDASLTTIYRRLATLQDRGLVTVHSTIGSGGEHKQLFETTIESFRVSIDDGELELAVETRDELADNFTSLWENFRENV
ncbi:helix-turn-helix domain-containing protein [Halorubrum sp. SD683]|uniref:ArsR/SmtB family transcription factor n=1 Tax=Halorubrum sp. SD683 TaxID=1855873 RepID=UPI000A2D1222|nr:helix-turn-helix domain-containing protein [Halorubrum sp. SD683]OTF01751.1 transcriptional regulator [Halorubrum sp. SD683]